MPLGSRYESLIAEFSVGIYKHHTNYVLFATAKDSRARIPPYE